MTQDHAVGPVSWKDPHIADELINLLQTLSKA